MTLMSTLNMITWKPPSGINFKNLRHFQGKYLWWGSVIVLSFGFAVILFMTEAVVGRYS